MNPDKPKRRPGGQEGRKGAFLEKIENPDEVKYLRLDSETLPAGSYRAAGYVTRQVNDIKITRHVLEFRAECLTSSSGEIFAASFPEHVSQAVLYCPGLKAQAVYLSQYQMIPYGSLWE